MSDEILAGGLANGLVVRRGDHIERQAQPHAAALHAHLRALGDAGFTGAPRPISLGADGRETLTFVEGAVAMQPYPEWALRDETLRSVGALLRRMHDAAGSVPVDASAGWPTEFADPEGGPILCHNDVAQENVVFRAGEAVALIDFDFAAPGRPLWDFAQAAWYWVPMVDPASAEFSVPGGVGAAAARLRILADGYGLADADRRLLPNVLGQVAERARDFVNSRVVAGDPVFVRIDAERSPERWDRIDAWQAEHRDAFLTALLGS